MRNMVGGPKGANRSIGDEVRKVVAAVGQVLDEAVVAIDKGLSDVARVVRGRPRPIVQTVVVFEVVAPTEWGETIWLVGDDAALGQRNPANGVPLAPAQYPIWSVSLALEPSTRVHYKYLRKNRDGSFTWEAVAENRALTVSPVATETRQRDELSWT